MGTKYSSNSASGYNSTPPSDDGTVSDANKGKWSTIKDKLADPVKTLADAINTDLVEHFDNGPVAYTSNQTLGASHYGKVIQASGSGTTLTLSDAATLGAGWNCEIISTDTTNTVTIGRATASDMVNETTANISLLPLQSIKATVNASANGFLVGFNIRKDKANSISEVITFVHTTAGTAPITIQSTDASAASGPILYLDRNSASPAASDDIGIIVFRGRDSAGNSQNYVYFYGTISDHTSGSEDGLFTLVTNVAGSEVTQLKIKDGALFGAATGSYKGSGTVNATAVYENGVKVGIGANQTWQDVSGSRAINTEYTNSTGKPIMVSAVMTHAVINGADLLVDGVSIARTFDPTGGSNFTLCGIIPNGSTYQVTANASIYKWSELR